MGIITAFITEKCLLDYDTAKSNAQDERRTPLAAQVESRTLLAAFCVSRDLSCFRDSQRPDVRTLGRFGTISAEDQSNEKTSVRENTYVRNGPVEYAH